MAIQNFEDFVCWQRSRKLTKSIYVLTKDNQDFDFNSQIRRASVSICSNIAEGFDRTSREFRQFLRYSRASSNEVKSLLYIAEDLGYLQNEDSEYLRNECFEISKMIFSLMKKLE